MTGEHELHGNSAVTESELETDELLTRAERFSILSAGIARILSDLTTEMKKALDQFHATQSVVEIKKKELRMLHDIDVSAMSLKQLIEDQRAQRENLERLRNSHRANWEGEKARLDREEKEYRDNIKIQRQCEEEEYRRTWASELLKAQQSIEEDLRVAKQRCRQMQETMERDCLEREQILQGKELECSRLMQELERLMLRVNSHVKPEHAALSPLEKKALLDQSESSSESPNNHREPLGRGVQSRFHGDLHDKDTLIPN
jgi:hypothetical protein